MWVVAQAVRHKVRRTRSKRSDKAYRPSEVDVGPRSSCELWQQYDKYGDSMVN